jgi:hypothetical protein
MAIFASTVIKIWSKHRHRNTLSYYQLRVDAEVKRPYTKRRGSGRTFYPHLAVSTHEIYSAPPPPPLQGSVLDLVRWEVAGRKIHISSGQTDA